jgi:hypothetical protein
MPRQSALDTITAALTDLRAQRQAHLDALAEIDALFAKFGISAATTVRQGRKPGRPAGVTAAIAPKKRRKRGHFAQTAQEFVLGLVKSKSMTTAQVNAAWKEAGRGATANTTLSTLVKGKKIKKNKVKGIKGSSYTAT